MGYANSHGGDIDISGFHRLTADRARERERKERKCLRCQRPFQSAGPGNRRCKRCQDRLTEYERQDGNPHDPFYG